MKSILITGGSGKIGFQLVNHFLAKDFKVITTTRNIEAFLERKVKELNSNYKKALKLIEVDFTQKQALEKILTFLKDNDLKVNNLIHNARALEYLRMGPNGRISSENFAGEFYMDVIFPYQLTVEILQSDDTLKNVVFISSIYGNVAPTPALYDDFQNSSPINYGVSKAAQIHLTKELAVRLAPEVRVNCVSFGGVKGRTNEEFEKRYKSLNPLGNMLSEKDVSAPVDFLISEGSKDMTGQNINVDGGWTIW